MSVNYDNLVITGIPYLSVKKLEITQQVNHHAAAEVHLEVDKEEGQSYMQEVHEGEVVTIGIPEVVFAGLIESASINYENSYNVLKLKLVSTSMLWDLQKTNRSYQKIGTNYSQIMRQATNGLGTVEFYGKDLVSDSLIVQYQETIWEFILRLASVCGEPVYVNPAAATPHITVGSGNSKETHSSTVSGTGGEAGTTRGYVSLGGKTAGGAGIGGTKSSMQQGELLTSYNSLPADGLVPVASPPKFAGRVMAGKVQAVERDMVQVHITDLDNEYDGGSNTWFKYSTLYSSGANDAGIYCMPVVGDPVRVFFPSENLSEAFASSSQTVRGILGDHEEKCFHTPDGMMVLFGKEGLFLSCKNKNIEILLYKDGRVAISSETAIGVHAKGNIAMMANEGEITVQSDDKVCLVTGNSMISMGKKGIMMVSDRIMTQ